VHGASMVLIPCIKWLLGRSRRR